MIYIIPQNYIIVKSALKSLGVVDGIKGLKSLEDFAILGLEAFPNLSSAIIDVKNAFVGSGGGLNGALSAIKSSASGLWSLIKAHPFVAVTAAITVASIALKAYRKSQEDYQNSLKKTIDTANENIQKYTEEKDSLLALQDKLESSKNNKTELLSIQGELNKAIGETPGLLQDEGNAYDIANGKIEARIRELDELAKKEAQRKIDAQKEIFMTNTTPYEFGVDDFEEVGLNIDMQEAANELARYKNLRQGAIEIGAAEDSPLVKGYDKKIARYTEILQGKTEEAKEIFSDYIDSEFNDEISKSYVNKYIESLIFGGEDDLDNIQREIDTLKPKIEKFNDLKNELLDFQIDGKNTDGITSEIQALIDEFKKISPEVADLMQASLNSLIQGEESINSGINKNYETFGKSIINDVSQQNKALSNYIDTIDNYQRALKRMESTKIDPSQTKFGNIDTDGRSVIDWTDEELSKYESALNSWGKNIGAMRGTISSIFGSSDTFDGVKIGFTPMLETENGAVLLDKDTVYKYIYGLIEKAGEGWTGEDLFNLDATGLEIDGVKINNLLASIGETETGSTLNYLQVYDEYISSLGSIYKTADILGISVEELIGKYGEFSTELEDNKQKILEYESALSESASNAGTVLEKIEGLSNGLDKLDEIYAKILKGKDFDLSSILNNKEFKESFSSLGDSYTDFIKTIAENSSDVNACQDAFNNLATAYIENSGALNGLTESTRDSAIAMLEQMGIANATEIVDGQLALQKARLALQTEENANKTYEEVVADFKLAEAGSVTQQALAELALAKINVNNAQINTASDIAQVIALANAANASATSMAALYQAMSVLSLTPGTAAHFHAIDTGEYAKAQATVDAINNGTFDYDFKGLNASDFTANYTGGSSSSGAGSSGGSGGSGSSSDSTKVVDWIETSIDRIERRINKLKNTISNTYKSFKNRFSSSKDEISAITDEIVLQEKAYDRYMAQANSVGLSPELAKKVRDGSIDISEYDSDTAELINDYKEWCFITPLYTVMYNDNFT